MKNKIIFSIMAVCLMIVLVSNIKIVRGAEPSDVFILTLKYEKGDISTQSLLKTQAVFYPPANQPIKGYNLSVISFNNKTLYSQRFDFSLEVHFAPDPKWFDERGNQVYFPSEQETTITLDNATIELMIPYFKDASRIEIRDKDGGKVLVFNVNENKLEDLESKNAAKNGESEKEVTPFYKKEGFVLIMAFLIILAILVLIKSMNSIKRGSPIN